MNHSILKFKDYRLQATIFLLVGVIIGTLLAIQIRSDTVVMNEGVLQTIQIENNLLTSFTKEHKELSLQLEELQQKRKELEDTVEKNSSKKLQNELKILRASANLQEIEGEALFVTIEDGVAGGAYMTAADMRDLVNSLYLQGARAISVNGKRVSAVVAIRDAFDTIFIGNHQVASPFKILVLGNYESLLYATRDIRLKKFKVNVQRQPSAKIISDDSLRPFIYTKLLTPEAPLSL